MSSKRKALAIVGAMVAFVLNFSAVGITRFSDLQIVAGPGGDPVLNAQRWRAWAGDRKSVLIDCTDEPFDFNTGGTPIELGYHRLSVQIEGPSCAGIRHVGGAGGFLSFNGGATHAADLTARRVYFGQLGREIAVSGAVGAGTNSADLIFISRIFDGHFNARTRDADVHVRVNDYSSIGSERLGLVNGTLNITSGQGSDVTPIAVGSRIIVTGTYVYNATARLHLETNGWIGQSGKVPNPQYAAIFDQSRRVKLKANSTMESNLAGGIKLTSSTDSFNIETTDNEANNPDGRADAYDWFIRGARHNIVGIVGNAYVDADRVNFVGCTFLGLTVPPSATGVNTYTDSTWTSGGPRSTDKVWN